MPIKQISKQTESLNSNFYILKYVKVHNHSEAFGEGWHKKTPLGGVGFCFSLSTLKPPYLRPLL